MVSRALVQPGRAGAWRWPLEPDAYDRRTRFTPPELAALRRRVEGRTTAVRNPRELAWVLEPVRNIAALFGGSTTNRCRQIAQAFDAMHRRGVPIWAWDRDVVLALCADPAWKGQGAQMLVAVGYVLQRDLLLPLLVPRCNRPALARAVFGTPPVEDAERRVGETLRGWGYHTTGATAAQRAVASLLLANGSPRLEDLSQACVDRVAGEVDAGRLVAHELTNTYHAVTKALRALGIIAREARFFRARALGPAATADISPAWHTLVTFWFDHSTIPAARRRDIRSTLIRTGRWLAKWHPAVQTPDDWTRETALAFVKAVDGWRVGDYCVDTRPQQGRLGKPITPNTKAQFLQYLRKFFQDLQDWGKMGRRFPVRQWLATPREILALVGPNPRDIQRDIWAKLMWAGLHLTEADWRAWSPQAAGKYPFRLIHALAVTWLCSALRSDEIVRLRVGCIEQRRDAVTVLHVPVHKTGLAFAKAVEGVLGHAIRQWEAERPAQPKLLDPKTNELVDYLFCYRGRRLPKEFLNEVLIPLLCKKAGTPAADARGSISSHRARSTIASELANADVPWSLWDLMAWLGHADPSSTAHYLRPSVTKQAARIQAAGHLKSSLRMLDVLVDTAPAPGQPTLYYDLGHGYCTFARWEGCQHRMACAKCVLYRPKDEASALFAANKGTLERLLKKVELTDEERLALEDDLGAIQRLLRRLADTPTPAGPTPHQLHAGAGSDKRPLPVLPSQPQR